MNFDPKCHELAEHFLGADADPRLINEMAQDLQGFVEAWLSDVEVDGDRQREAAE